MGGKYMMEAAIEMLRQQGHSGDRSRIVMVGDRFDTDIRAGLSVGIRTCLVTTGCHNLGCQKFYRMDPAHYHAPGVVHLTPRTPSEVAGDEQRDSGEALREWVLGQGNVLRPSSIAAC